jgi:flagella basal body P-ring formation protein FlgA
MQEDFLRIQMAGIAEQNGDLGGTIRVRIMRTNGDDQSMLQQLSGIVRGPSDVEIQP